MGDRVALLGANGVYARHLIPRLTASGHSVIAIVRRPDTAGHARACGAQTRIADIFDCASMARAFEGVEVAINLATSLPGPSGRGNFAANDKLRIEGAPNFVEACRQAGVTRIVQQSIAFVCASGNDEWTDEDYISSGAGDSISAKAIRAALAMENVITAAPLDWLILRGGLFYGPGTGFDDGWFARASAGKLRLPGDGADFVSLIHIADMAEATCAALAHWPSRAALNISDEEPVRWRDLFGFIAESVNQPPPEPGGQIGFPSFRLRNARAKAALNWAPFFATYREGLSR